jgi:DNA-binding CsgD family transcriptional regulator
MDTLTKLMMAYNELLNSQQFVEADLDYSVFQQQIPFLEQMAQVKNSGITVFDMFKREHVFASYNLEDIFGYDYQKVQDIGTDYFNSRLHPDDLFLLTKKALVLMRFILALPVGERKDYKLQNEYRILNKQNHYIRIIEQHTLLELDVHGNIWLSLSVVDISPNQDSQKGVVSQLVNIRTGKVVDYRPLSTIQTEIKEPLTKRETEILQLMKEGLLSKEISDNLSLSVHTVNTHRQNILKKLGAANSIEAIEFGTRIGLV